MSKKKKNKSNTPRRKHYNQKDRLQNAKKWIKEFEGKNIAKSYSNWFGVDLICAITELEMLGYKFKQNYKDQVKKSLMARQKQKEKRKRKEEYDQQFTDDTFYFIAGYTPNGIPYGISHEEMEDRNEEPAISPNKKDNNLVYLKDEELPF